MAQAQGVFEGGVDQALAQIGYVWNGNSVIYWKCALENRSNSTITPLGSSANSGCLDTNLPEIPPNHTGVFVWVKSQGAATGASGVVYYSANNQILNIMASIPYDSNLYSAYCNACVSSSEESFNTLYNGSPTKAGNWGKANGVQFYLQDKSKAELKIIYSG